MIEFGDQDIILYVDEVICNSCGWRANMAKPPIFCPNCEEKGIDSFYIVFDRFKLRSKAIATHGTPIQMTFSVEFESPEDYRRKRNGKAE